MYLLVYYNYSIDILEFVHIYFLMYYKILEIQNTSYDNLQEDKNQKGLDPETRIVFQIDLNDFNDTILI